MSNHPYTRQVVFCASYGRLNAANSRGAELMRHQDTSVQTFRESGLYAVNPPSQNRYAIIAHYVADDEHAAWRALADEIKGYVVTLKEWTGGPGYPWRTVKTLDEALVSVGLERPEPEDGPI